MTDTELITKLRKIATEFGREYLWHLDEVLQEYYHQCKPIQTQAEQDEIDRTTDASGNTFSDADNGLQNLKLNDMKPNFKQEYADKLKELGVYDQFVKNWVKSKPHGMVKDLNEQESFCDFIWCAFVWSKSPEGIDFWATISKA